MAEFLMPSLGADMESAMVVEWLVKPGDTIRSGDIIAAIETDKGLIDIEVFEDGVIEALVAPLEQELPVGAVLALIKGKHDTATTTEVPVVSEPVVREPAAPAPTPSEPEPARAQRARVDEAPRLRASPAARRRAEELGIELATVPRRGADLAITLDDVERAASTQTPPAVRDAAPASGMRNAISAAVSRSKREIPHYYLCEQLNLERALEWLAAANAERAITERVLPAALLIRACALALKDIPGFNGRFEQGRFSPAASVHLGWAIGLRTGGLIAPAIHDADTKDLNTVMVALRDLVKRTRSGGLRSSELMDASVTVTSLGERGTEMVWPIIYPPQVAMIGFGRIVERPWVSDGSVRPCQVVSISLAADHRVSDGHDGSRLLMEIGRLLNEPETLDA